MNRNTLNKIAAYVAIISGMLLIVGLLLIAPDLRPQSVLSWKFVMAFVFIAIGIFALRTNK